MKLDAYQRLQMIKGIDPKNDTYNDTKQKLFALGEVTANSDPNYMQSRLTYQEFLKDPTQKKVLKDQTEEGLAQAEFSSNIRFIETTQNKETHQQQVNLVSDFEKNRKNLTHQNLTLSRLQGLMNRVNQVPIHALE